MNREQRREAGKGLPDQRIDVSGIVVHFANGQYLNLDTEKAQVVDKGTGRPIFEEVLEKQSAKIGTNYPVSLDLPPNNIRKEFNGESNYDDDKSYTVQFDTPEGKMEYVKNGNWSGVRAVK